jgi:tRNA G18 (ribose-2'-O)-methylase SpoU
VRSPRGYFGVGVEGLSKPMNLGALMRTAHAFGASFTFTVDAAAAIREVELADTSKSTGHVPHFAWPQLADMQLPQGCQLVGVELADDAVDLPVFRHPHAAAYVLGRERGDLTPAMLQRCAHVVRIPTRFCLNVAVAAALVMYDRVLSLGGWPPRPIMPGGPAETA